MSQIEIYRNRDAGPAWCAIGELGDAGYYAGADTRGELLAQIREAAEMEGVDPEIVTVETDGAEEHPVELASRAGQTG
ncbi:MAG: hypothetical protein OXH86_03380 [Acidimicrobiaceae bacterium]|nr:hypothetical protein [Acidimicrobiaceae bacterium]MDE0496374.1 hypothetical protein [Acidimicrobiaceae bacterium]